MKPSTLVPVFDGHNDALLRLYRKQDTAAESFFEDGHEGHLDYPRALRGGIMGGFFAVWVPADPDDPQESHKTETENGYIFRMAEPLSRRWALEYTIRAIGTFNQMLQRSAGRVIRVESADDLERCAGTNVLAALLHLEGAEAISEDLVELEALYGAGLRSLGPVWSRCNIFADGVPFALNQTPDFGGGLTEAGKRLLRRCGELGMVIDLSHLNYKGFMDAAKITDKPLVVTHACSYSFAPKARNLLDDQIKAVRDTGGIIGFNYTVGDIRPDGQTIEDTSADLVVRHFLHLLDLAGVDHVALGSDFDGTTVPAFIGDASGVNRLIQALGDAGLAEDELVKIGYKNWVRVLKQIIG